MRLTGKPVNIETAAFGVPTKTPCRYRTKAFLYVIVPTVIVDVNTRDHRRSTLGRRGFAAGKVYKVELSCLIPQ